MSRELLAAGLMGLMLSGMLPGNMPSMGVYAVSVAGLATNNIYKPLVKGKSEQHYFRAGQWAIGGVLAIAVVFASCLTDVGAAYTMQVTFNISFSGRRFFDHFLAPDHVESNYRRAYRMGADDGDIPMDIA